MSHSDDLMRALHWVSPRVSGGAFKVLYSIVHHSKLKTASVSVALMAAETGLSRTAVMRAQLELVKVDVLRLEGNGRGKPYVQVVLFDGIDWQARNAKMSVDAERRAEARAAKVGLDSRPVANHDQSRKTTSRESRPVANRSRLVANHDQNTPKLVANRDMNQRQIFNQRPATPSVDTKPAKEAPRPRAIGEHLDRMRRLVGRPTGNGHDIPPPDPPPLEVRSATLERRPQFNPSPRMRSSVQAVNPDVDLEACVLEIRALVDAGALKLGGPAGNAWRALCKQRQAEARKAD